MVARRLARLLAVSGQVSVRAATRADMKYDEIRRHVREHFRDLLRRADDRIAEVGPMEDAGLDALRASQGLAEWPSPDWAALIHPDGADGLLRAFCDLRGIPAASLSPDKRALILDELRIGHGAYAAEVLASQAKLGTYDLREVGSAVYPATIAPPQALATPFREVVAEYLREIGRPGALAAKTLHDRTAAANLLGEITSDKPLAELTKADAREVKDVLMRLPANRNKIAALRGKPLAAILDIGKPAISSKTMNGYIGDMSALLSWAVANGHASENVFAGMKIRNTGGRSSAGRDAFDADELRLMFRHLTHNPDALVKTDTHKWGSLIGMFTGMRVNEVAQLQAADVQNRDGVWCILVTEDGDDRKRLKSKAAVRSIPVHDRLIANGFLDFVDVSRTSQGGRLFPDLSYTAKNGYGRNLGRWFNETFLPTLGLKSDTLVYHSLRTTMTTRLFQAGAPDAHVKAIVGHEQQGVTYQHYFRDGFLPHQLKATLDQFDF